jgi:hypothetical protein
MTTNTTIGLVAAGLALAVLAPLAGANLNDDTLSRTFPYISGARAHANGYIGWYDNAAAPNVCALSFPGGQVPIGGLEYDEALRISTNLPGFTRPTTVPGAPLLPAACPAIVNPLCSINSGCAIRIPSVTVGPHARTIIPQDGLVCVRQSAFITCIVTGSRWTISACPWASATFAAPLPGKGGVPFLMSSDINCAAYVHAGFDATFLLGSGGNLLSSGFDGVPASLLVRYANGADDTAFAVSCLVATYTTIDTSTVIPTIGSATEDGVDWSLVLDLDAPGGAGWLGALLKHVGAGNLPGVYDLEGGNDCDFAGTVALPQCFDGIDNDGDGVADVDDDLFGVPPPPGVVVGGGCYHHDPVTGLDFYDAADPNEL